MTTTERQWRAQCRDDAAWRAEAKRKLAPNAQTQAALARIKTRKRGIVSRILRRK